MRGGFVGFMGLVLGREGCFFHFLKKEKVRRQGNVQKLP